MMSVDVILLQAAKEPGVKREGGVLDY